MKNNTTDTKRLIQQALAAMPNDNTLSEARHHLRAALNHVDNVEQKRLRREAVQKQNELKTQFNSMGNLQGNPAALRESLKAIDDMIEKEQKKLEEIANRKKQRQHVDVNDGDGGDSVITG